MLSQYQDLPKPITPAARHILPHAFRVFAQLYHTRRFASFDATTGLPTSLSAKPEKARKLKQEQPDVPWVVPGIALPQTPGIHQQPE